MKKEETNNGYNNPILENYFCEGQITIEEWLNQKITVEKD